MIDAKLSHNAKLIITTILILIGFVWNRYGNFKSIIRDYSEIIVSLFCIIILLITLSINFFKSEYKGLRIGFFLLLATIPILTLIKIQLLSTSFIIIYCVGLVAIYLTFRNELKILLNKY